MIGRSMKYEVQNSARFPRAQDFNILRILVVSGNHEAALSSTLRLPRVALWLKRFGNAFHMYVLPITPC